MESAANAAIEVLSLADEIPGDSESAYQLAPIRQEVAPLNSVREQVGAARHTPAPPMARAPKSKMKLMIVAGVAVGIVGICITAGMLLVTPKPQKPRRAAAWPATSVAGPIHKGETQSQFPATSPATTRRPAKRPAETAATMSLVPSAIQPRVTDSPQISVFHPIAMGARVDDLTPTEDGRFLIVMQRARNLLTVLDIRSGKIAATLASDAPSCVLARGNLIYVSSDGQGTITTFGIGENWKQTAQIRLDDHSVSYLSAPQGNSFHGQILASCALGKDDAHLYVIDTLQSTARRLDVPEKFSAATVTRDGQHVLLQNYIHGYPGGNPIGL